MPGTRALFLMTALLTPTLASAETCLSPFVKRLDRPEKFLYVFCVDADAKDNDFVAVIDVNPDSSAYGTLIHTLDLGTKGNETHHWGFTDDRTRIWAGGLLSSRVWIIDVATDPAKPRIETVLEAVSQQTGLSGPHTYYALPGRMLVNFLGAADGGLPAGMAEFTNDGKFIRRIENPKEAPYGYDVAIKPGLNRMVSSSFTPRRNYKKPLAQMDMKDFGSEMVVWDFKERKPLQVGKTGLAPLEVRWSLKPENNYGFTNCALDNSIWLFRGRSDGPYEFKKVAQTGAFPVDLRQSPDDRYLFVSCFGDNLIQQWDVTDPDQPKLFSTVSPVVQPNMMHLTGDGKRMYVTNSLLSTLDHAGRFYVRLVHIGPDGMKVDPFFNIDLNTLPTGPARSHDMLLN
ncbi:selenium-binding protein 1 [Singulisphaera sp. GP187]|uniref:selenium-binding protein SBP56-related protein n=1 Tax=Singulisphaera sp. GP187 TaxID=1882752 RepID=UPI00092BEA17|nr:selenium-binding protein SBP56-related protein [Singulisphaera sp. GP187]SIO43014.1 selenium-binding protein 1 [Singulisphaera sp. GP187]